VPPAVTLSQLRHTEAQILLSCMGGTAQVIRTTKAKSTPWKTPRKDDNSVSSIAGCAVAVSRESVEGDWYLC